MVKRALARIPVMVAALAVGVGVAEMLLRVTAPQWGPEHHARVAEALAAALLGG